MSRAERRNVLCGQKSMKCVHLGGDIRMTEPIVPDRIAQIIIDYLRQDKKSPKHLEDVVLKIQSYKELKKENYQTLVRYVQALCTKGIIQRQKRGVYYI